MPDNVAQDAATNGNQASAKETVTVGDVVRPDVHLLVPSGVQTGSFVVSVAFTDPVTGFEQSELNISGTAGIDVTDWSAQSDRQIYTAWIRPTSDGTAIFNVAANVAQDDYDNWNTVATQKTVTVNLPLTVTEERPGVNISVPAGVQTGTFFVLVAFTQPVTGFVQSEFSVSGSSGSTIRNWVSRPGGSDYIARVTPSSDGNAVFHVAAGVAQNSADNWNTAATQKIVTADVTAPTVSIAVPSIVQGGDFDVTVEFSESVTGTSGAAITNWAPQPGGSDYIATITPSNDGTVIFNVAAEVAQDSAEHKNTAAMQKSVTVDVTRANGDDYGCTNNLAGYSI